MDGKQPPGRSSPVPPSIARCVQCRRKMQIQNASSVPPSGQRSFPFAKPICRSTTKKPNVKMPPNPTTKPQKAHPQTLEATKTLRENFTPASSVVPGSWFLGPGDRPRGLSAGLQRSRESFCARRQTRTRRFGFSSGQHLLAGEDHRFKFLGRHVTPLPIMPCGFGFWCWPLCPAKSGLRLTTYLGRGGVVPSSSARPGWQSRAVAPSYLRIRQALTPGKKKLQPPSQRQTDSCRCPSPNSTNSIPRTTEAHITLPEAATLPLRNHIPGSISMRTLASSRGSPLFFSDSVTRNISPPLTPAVSGLRRARDSRSEELEMELKLDDGEAEGEAETTSLMRRASKTLLSEEERRGMGGGRVRGVVGDDGGERVAGDGDGRMMGVLGDWWMMGVVDGDGLAVWS